MGYGLPAAIADPPCRLFCFAGDGDFQMTSEELATAAQADAGPIVVILNNGTYATKERNNPERVLGIDPVNPDCMALAHKAHAERVAVTADFALALAATAP